MSGGGALSPNAHGIANRIRETRRALLEQGAPTSVSFLLVEGVDEDKLYDKLIERGRCRVQIAHGKPNVVGALAVLDAEGFAGIVAIADADFDTLEGREPPSPNLIFTDQHDLETMLLVSPALDDVLKQRACREDAAVVRDKLLEIATPIGYLRWYNDQEKKGLRFDDLEVERFVDERTLAIDLEELLRTLRNRSRSLVIVTDEELWRRAAALRDPSHDRWLVCCGHDLVRVLSVALRKAFGANNEADVKPARLEESLRLAFSRAHFQRTRLCAAIAAWEAENPAWIILSR